MADLYGMVRCDYGYFDVAKANIRYKRCVFKHYHPHVYLSLALCSVINTDNIRINLNASLDHVEVGDFVMDRSCGIYGRT